MTAAIPAEVGGATLDAEMVRLWPGHGQRRTATGAAARARRPPRSASPIAPMRRGGASDASHFAAAIPVTVDGLGPRGGAAHNPDEYIARGVARHARRGRARASRSAALSR